MNKRSFSEEEMRQREQEARSRQRKQDQAYREAQRGVYDRIYQNPDQDLLWGDPRDRLYDRVQDEDEWADERRQIREELWDDPWPRSTAERRAAPPEDRRPPPRRPRPPAAQTGPRPPVRREGQGGVPRKKKRWKTVLLVILVLLALAGAALAVVHFVYVRPPEIPTQEAEEAGTNPGSMGAGRKEGVYTFLLVGRDDGGGGNTDTIMVGCFDVNNKTLDVLSIYRDTCVDVPWEIPKINSVYNRQGIEGLQTQVKNLIGYRPDFYFVVELNAVSELVDAIGGVDYEVPNDMHYDDPTQDLHIHFEAGMQHIDGDDAVKILRWRKNNSGESLSVGDVGRVEIQHSFLRALAKEMVSIGTLTKIGDIVDIMNRNLISNLNYGEMIWFGEKALGLGADSIRFHNLPGDYTGTIWSPTYKNYQSYVFVNSTALRELVNQYMNPYQAEITADMQHVVHDTTVNNLPVEDNPTAAAGTGQGETSNE